MEIKNISLEDIEIKYPECIIHFLNNLQNSTSKEKNKNVESMKFSFVYAMQLNGLSKNIVETDKEITRDIIYDWLKKSLHWSILAKIGRWRCYYRNPKYDIPEIFVDNYVKSLKQQQYVWLENQKLTSEEKRIRLQRLLGELSQDPGFTIFSVR